MLIGEYSHTMDAKGRLILPSKFRSELGERFIVTKGFDGCLYGYSIEEWKNIEETLYLSSLPGMVDDINNIRKNENWENAKEFNPDEEW